jgi:hypothetical protein
MAQKENQSPSISAIVRHIVSLMGIAKHEKQFQMLQQIVANN